MSTLSLRAPSLPKIFLLPSVAITRAIAFLFAVIDVYVEVQCQVAEAERHFPFMAW
jgi:hypothetical protein